MRFSIAILISLISTVSFGQNSIAIKNEIDAEVKQIRTDTKQPTVTFSIQARKKVLHYINYNYVENTRDYLRISRQFHQKNESIQQTFYLNNGQLIFANETIVTYFTTNSKTDSITWSADFYFSNGKLIDHITLGHGKSELESWEPGTDMTKFFNESLNDIDRYKKNKTSNGL